MTKTIFWKVFLSFSCIKASENDFFCVCGNHVHFEGRYEDAQFVIKFSSSLQNCNLIIIVAKWDIARIKNKIEKTLQKEIEKKDRTPFLRSVCKTFLAKKQRISFEIENNFLWSATKSLYQKTLIALFFCYIYFLLPFLLILKIG